MSENPTVKKSARATLTVVEMNHGEVLEFKLKNGRVRRLKVVDTWAGVLLSNAPGSWLHRPEGPAIPNRMVYGFHCRLELDGKLLTLERVVGTQDSFYEPMVQAGVRIWLDAVDGIFSFLEETHGSCRPAKQARLVLQDASLDICPEKIRPWFAGMAQAVRIENCYTGEDCWLGAYDAKEAHGGLDLNLEPGTLLTAPIKVDGQGLSMSVEKGGRNNYWQGRRSWPDGSEWVLEAGHMGKPLAKAGKPLAAGGKIGPTGLTAVGYVPHVHFRFLIRQDGQEYTIDPWIMIWQGLRDEKKAFPAPEPALKFTAMSDLSYEMIHDRKAWPVPTRALRLSGVEPGLKAGIAYEGKKGWLKLEARSEGLGVKVFRLAVDARGLAAGSYAARLRFTSPGSPAREQAVELKVTPLSPLWHAMVDDKDEGFEASPGWLAPPLTRGWNRPGYGGRSFFSRPDAVSQTARFTPFLYGGFYRVSFGPETPFDPAARFSVRIRHRRGEESVWVEPAQSLWIGDFHFAYGAGGWAEIRTEGSAGQVTADAVFFTRIGD